MYKKGRRYFNSEIPEFSNYMADIETKIIPFFDDYEKSKNQKNLWKKTPKWLTDHFNVNKSSALFMP